MVLGDPTPTKIRMSTLQLACVRALVVVHFAFELVDKLWNWHKWCNVIGDAGLPLPEAELGLVVFNAVMMTVGVFTHVALLLFCAFVQL